MRMKVTAPSKHSVRLASTNGVVIRIEAGESRNVPAGLATKAAEQGCKVEPVKDEDDEDPDKAQVQDDVERLKELQRAVDTVVERGDPEDFTATGRPKKVAVSKETTVEFSSQELNSAFEASLDRSNG